MDFCQQNDVSAFCLGLYNFSSKEQASFDFVAVVTVCSDFGAQEKKISLFPLFSLLFAIKWWDQMPWS